MERAKRMDAFGESIFTTLKNMKVAKEATGTTVIDLSTGAPNIPPADFIIDALIEAAKDKKNYVYAINDSDELLDAVVSWYKRRYNVTLDAKTEVMSLLGSQDGLSHLALSLVNPGDTVLVMNPSYPIFRDGPLLAGAKIADIPLKEEKNYIIDFNDINEEDAKAAKLMIVSYPNNPTCAVAPDSFYPELIDFAKKYNILVLHDNAYSELRFDQTGPSFLAFEGAKDVGIEFNSLSKTYGLAGMRAGFAIGNKDMIAALKTLKSNTDFGMFIPIQKAAIAAITHPDQSCVENTRNAYKHRRDFLIEGFKKIGWDIKTTDGTMFVWAKIPSKYKTSNEFVFELIDKAGVLVVPGSAFGSNGEGYVRMALIQDDDVILEAIDRIEKANLL